MRRKSVASGITSTARSTREIVQASTLEAGLDVLSRAVRYHDWLADELGPYLRPPVLEIGSGLGTLAFAMSRWHKPVLASEPDSAMEERLRIRCAETADVRVVPGIFLPEVTYVPDPAPRTVMMSNVLEHIPDDVGALKAIATSIPSVERVALVIPAHQWAYGPLDEELGHHRRYDREGLRVVVEKAGWRSTFARYFNPLGAIAWAVSGRVFKRAAIAGWQTTLVERIVPALRAADRLAGGRMFGQSLIAICDR